MALQSLTADVRNPVLGRIGEGASPDMPGMPHLDEILPPYAAPQVKQGDPGLPSAPMPDLPAYDAPAVGQDKNELLASVVRRDLMRRMHVDESGNPLPGPTSVLGKIGHGFAVAGNVLGDIFAPSTMALIPGTQLNNEAQKGKDRQQLGELSDLENQEAQRAQTQAATAYTKQRPDIEKAKLNQKLSVSDAANMQKAASHGQSYQRDPDTGEVTIQDDPKSEIFQRNQIKEQLLDAQVKDANAQKDLRDAETELKNAGSDPTSPAYQLALQKVEVSRQNAAATTLRAKAYWANYLQHAYNKGLGGDTLPGAPVISDEQGNQTVVGSTNAANAINANAHAGQFADVHGSLDDVEKTALALQHSGGSFNSPALGFAMQHIASTPGMFLQSIDKAGLTPAERDYAIALNAAHERIQGMRKSAGGSATDSQVSNLLSMLPNASTPDLPYLLKQTGQIRSTADLIGKGAATATGGLSVRGQRKTPGSGSAPKEGDTKFNSSGDKVVFRGGKWEPA